MHLDENNLREKKAHEKSPPLAIPGAGGKGG